MSTLAESCVSSGLVFWDGTDRLINWSDHPHAQVRKQENALTIVIPLRRSYKSQSFTVGVGLRQGCVLSPLLFILCELDRQAQPSRWRRHCWKLQDQLFAICAQFDTACILWTGSPAYTSSVFNYVRPNAVFRELYRSEVTKREFKHRKTVSF